MSANCEFITQMLSVPLPTNDVWDKWTRNFWRKNIPIFFQFFVKLLFRKKIVKVSIFKIKKNLMGHVDINLSLAQLHFDRINWCPSIHHNVLLPDPANQQISPNDGIISIRVGVGKLHGPRGEGSKHFRTGDNKRLRVFIAPDNGLQVFFGACFSLKNF